MFQNYWQMQNYFGSAACENKMRETKGIRHQNKINIRSIDRGGEGETKKNSKITAITWYSGIIRSRFTGGITIPNVPNPFELLITLRGGPSKNSVDDMENVFGESFMVAFSHSSRWLTRFASAVEMPLLLLLFNQSSIDFVYWLLFAFRLWLLPFAPFGGMLLLYCCGVFILDDDTFGFWRVRFWSERIYELQ